MKRFYIIAVMCLVALTGLKPTLQAQTIWNGTADVTWYDASQTSFDISTPEQLAGLAQLVNTGTSFNGVSLNLTNDIWLNNTGDSTNNWTPIGGGSPTGESPSTGNAFKGNFNGHGHAIYNLYCDKGNTFHAGLFCALENPCTIDSLVMVNPVLKSRGMMGCIAGYPRGSSSVYVRYCLVINARIEGVNTSGSNNIGCIFGATYPNNGSTYVENCGATGSITGYYPGGMSGNAERSYTTNFYFAGTLYAYGTNYGGVAAHGGSFTNCYSYTQVLSSTSQSSASSDGTPVTQTEMQSANMITLLGDAFKEDNGINNGYPIMSYMAGVDPVAVSICQGETVTLTAFGYDSYLWDNGATSESITVSPTTTTTYSVTGTLNGVSATHTSTVTVFPQAVITATVVPSADGQTHGTVTPETSNVPCGSTQTVTLTITPDVNWHISRIVQDGVVLREDDPSDGAVVNFTIDPQGTLANVQVYFDNLYNITVSQQLDDGSPITLSNLVSPWGTNGVYAATAGNDLTYTFTSSDRYHVTDVEIDGASQGVITSYTFPSVDQTHSIVVTYADSCGIFSLPYSEDFSNGFSECWYKNSTYSSTYPYISSSRLYFYTSSSTYTYAVLPEVADDLPYQVNQLQVSFNAQYSTLNNQLQIGVMTDPADISTFMPVEAVANTATGTMQPHIVYLGTYNGSGKFIAFRWSGTSSGSCYLDDVVVDVAPTCSNVMNLQVSNIYGTNATLTWEPNAMGETVEYVIVVTDASQASVTYTTTETSYLLTGLDEQTAYTVSVQPDCGGSDYGAPETVNFTTPCIAPIEAVNNSYPTSTYSTEGNHFPMSNHYLNSFTEQIYLPGDFNNVSAEFSGMSFQYNDGQVITRTLDIYMAHTADNEFVQNVWATPTDSYVHVYSGPVTFSTAGTNRWVDIAFDTNFYYNGSDNLLLIVNDITGSEVNNSNAKFYTINTNANRSQCKYTHEATDNWSINNMPTTGTLHTQVNNIRLTACDVVSCIAPNTVAVGATDASSAEISWYNPNASQNCEIEYKGSSDADWSSTGSISGTSYMLTGLDANTVYQVRVRALCGANSESNWSETVTFRTECEAIVTMPYVQNFDSDTYGSGTDAYIYCWERYTTDPSKPVQMYPTSAAHSTPNAIRFYDGANVTNIAIMPKVDESINLNELQVDFYVRSTSSTAPVILELGVMTDKSDPTTFEVLDTIPAPYLPNNEYTLVEYSLANYTGYGHYIAFRASKGNGGHNLRLDDVTLNYIPMCQHPVNLAVDAVTSDEVTFHWSEVGDAFSWFVEYGPAGFTPGDGTTETSYDTTYTISGLNPNTQYDVYVWSDCGGLESTSITTTFRTDCGPIAELPFFEDFETGVYNTGMYNSSGQQDYIVCWNRYASDDAHHFYIPTGTTYSHSGSHYLDAHWTSNCFNIAIAPALDQSFDMSQLMVHFWACRTGSSGTLEVGIMDDPAADTTFFPIDTIDLSYMNTYAYDEKYVKFNTYTGTGKYVAFRVANASSCGYYIDDVTIDYAPACSPVSSLEISDISGTSAVVSWEAGFFGTVDSYTLEYSEGGQDNWTTVNNITETTYLLGGLNHSTYYDVRVKTNCSDGTNGDWVMETFRTNCLVGGDVTIGDGTTAYSYLPSYSFYSYSYTQQLFLASELGAPKDIESLTFDMTARTTDRNYSIYLMHTNATSGADWIDASSAQLVYSGTPSLSVGLNTFQFTTPFHYNGSDNLLLVVLDLTGSYTSGNTWKTHTAPFTASRYAYRDGTTYDISTPPTSGTGNSSTSNRNNVIFGSPCDTTTTCVAPHLSISAITSNGATVNWVAGYMESSWEMEYRPLSDTNWISVGTVTSMAEVISGLMPNTPYKVRMRSDCGGGEYSYWTETSFTTACGAITVTQDNPWTEDFENNTTMTCFDTPVIYTNSSGNSYPKMLLNYSLAAHSGGNSLEFKGTSNMVVLPEFTNDIHDLRMSFWATTWGVTTTAVVGVITDLDDPTSFETLGDAGTPGPRGPNGSTGNGNYMGPFDFNGVQANSGRIAILFSGVTSSDAGWNLDDFTVELTPNCPSPVKTSVTVTGVSSNSADVYWVDNDATHNSWTVYYKPSYADESSWQTQVANQIPATLTGLSSSTEYQVYVITNCSESDPVADATQTVSFTTLVSCPAPVSISFMNVVTDGADVSWVSLGDAAEWEIEYGLHGFAQGTGTTVTVYSQTYTLQNLMPSSQYDVYVRSICGAGDNSTWTGPASFSTACGAISVATTPWSTDFEGTDSELLNCWVSATTGYYNGNTFPHITNASIISHGGTHALEIAFGDIVTALPLFVENLSDLQVTFWAKHNNYSSDNPTMELGYVTDPYDANSFVSLETLTSSTYTQTTRTFADLAGQNLPSTSRIAFRYTRPTSSSLSSWYVDDLVVEYVGSGPVVTNPTVATNAADPIAQTTATLHATITNPDNVSISAKGFEWKVTTGGTYTQVAGTGTGNTFTAALSNLTPNTNYTFKAFITYNGQTVYGSEMTFTTLPEDTPEPCDAPTGLDTTLVANEVISVTWDANSNVNSWNIHYREADGQWTSANTTNNGYTITGLTGDRTYEIQVQAVCADGQTSDWSASLFVTTKNVGIDSWLENSVTLFPNPANNVVNVECTMNNVQGVEVFDVYGKLVNTVGVCDTPVQTRINVSGLADGMYFVRVTTDRGVVTKSFVKK